MDKEIDTMLIKGITAAPADPAVEMERILSELPAVTDTTVGRMEGGKYLKFSFMPPAYPLCGQTTLWRWMQKYGTRSALPIYERGCAKCKAIGSCQRIHEIRRAIQSDRERKPALTPKDGAVLTQLREFMSANSVRLEEEMARCGDKIELVEKERDQWVTSAEAEELIGSRTQMLKLIGNKMLEGKKQGRQKFYRKEDVQAAAEMVRSEVQGEKDRAKERAINRVFEVDGKPCVTKRMFRAMLMPGETNTLKFRKLESQADWVDAEADGAKFKAATLESVNRIIASWPVKKQEALGEKLRKRYGNEELQEKIDALNAKNAPKEALRQETVECTCGKEKPEFEASWSAEKGNGSAAEDIVREMHESAKEYQRRKAELPDRVFAGGKPTVEEDLDGCCEEMRVSMMPDYELIREFVMLLHAKLALDDDGLARMAESADAFAAQGRNKESGLLFSRCGINLLAMADSLLASLPHSQDRRETEFTIAAVLTGWLALRETRQG